MCLTISTPMEGSLPFLASSMVKLTKGYFIHRLPSAALIYLFIYLFIFICLFILSSLMSKNDSTFLVLSLGTHVLNIVFKSYRVLH